MPNSRCVIRSCRATTKSSKGLGISYHEIPSSAIREKWLEVINIPNVRAEAKVCSIHFREEDYKKSNKRRVLRTSAVPSLFLDSQQSIPDSLYDPACKISEYQEKGSFTEQVLRELKKSNALISTIQAPSSRAAGQSKVAVLDVPFKLTSSQSVQHFSSTSNVDPLGKSCSPTTFPHDDLNFCENYSNSLVITENLSLCETSLQDHSGTICSEESVQPQSMDEINITNIVEEPTVFSKPMTPDHLSPEPSTSFEISALAGPVELSPAELLPSSLLATHATYIDQGCQEERLYPIGKDCDHSYSQAPRLEELNDLGTSSQTIIISADMFQSNPIEENCWAESSSHNKALNDHDNLKLSVENSILRRKIIDLQREHNRSFKEKMRYQSQNCKSQQKKNCQKAGKEAHLKSKAKQSNQKCSQNQFRDSVTKAKEILKLFGRKKGPVMVKNQKASQLAESQGSNFLKQLNKLKKDSKDKNNVKAKFIIDQIKMYGASAVEYGDVTLQISRKWFQKNPEAYNQARSMNILTLPCGTIFKDDFRSYDPSDFQGRLLGEIGKLQVTERHVTLHLYESIIEDDCERNSSPSSGYSIPDRNHVVAFVLVGLNACFKMPCAYYFFDKICGHRLSVLSKNVIMNVENLGFTVVRMVVNQSSFAACIFEHLGMTEVPLVSHPSDPAKTIFLSYSSDDILRQVQDRFIEFSLPGFDDSAKREIRAMLLSKRCNSFSHDPPSLQYSDSKHLYFITMPKPVDVFSTPINAALSELKRMDLSIYVRIKRLFEMLEKWEAIECVLSVRYNMQSSEEIVFASMQDHRVTWLQGTFIKYLLSIQADKDCVELTLLHHDVLNALILSSTSSLLCLEHLVKCMGSFPVLPAKLIPSQSTLHKVSDKSELERQQLAFPQGRQISNDVSETSDSFEIFVVSSEESVASSDISTSSSRSDVHLSSEIVNGTYVNYDGVLHLAYDQTNSITINEAICSEKELSLNRSMKNASKKYLGSPHFQSVLRAKKSIASNTQNPVTSVKNVCKIMKQYKGKRPLYRRSAEPIGSPANSGLCVPSEASVFQIDL